MMPSLQLLCLGGLLFARVPGNVLLPVWTQRPEPEITDVIYLIAPYSPFGNLVQAGCNDARVKRQ